MPTKIAEAFVELDARTEPLRRDLGRAERRTRQASQRMSRGFQGVTRSVTALRAGIAGIVTAVGAGAFAGLVRQATALADSLDKTSERLGVNVEQLQQWRFAADQSGISARQFDIGLQRFLRRVGEAVQGTGELRDTLEALNFQLIEGEDGTETLGRFLETLGQIEDPTRRLAAAFKAFDSEGVVFLQFLAEGTEGLQSLLDQAVETGLVIDQRTIAALVELKDELGIVGQQAENLGSRIIADLSDELIGAARSVGRLITEFDAFLVRIGLLSENLAGKSIEELNRELEIAQGNFRRLLLLRAEAGDAGPAANFEGDRLVDAARERIALIERQIELLQQRNRVGAQGAPRSIADEAEAETRAAELSAIELQALIDQQILDRERARDQAEARQEERARREIDRQQRVADAQRRAFASSFADLVLEGENTADRLREIFLRRFVEQIGLQIANLFNAAQGGGGGFFGSALGVIGGAFGIPSPVTAAAAGAVGGGGGASTVVNISSPVPMTARQGSGGGASVEEIIVEPVVASIMGGGRAAQAIEQRFGVSRQGTVR